MATTKPIFRCTWCCKDTESKPCQHCGNECCVVDRTKPHTPEWSRKTIATVECKICDRQAPYASQGIVGDRCNPQKRTFTF